MRKYAYWLTLLLIFILPWENAVIVSGVGRVTKVVGLLVAAYWLGTVFLSGRIRQITPVHLLIFLYFLWHGVTLMWSVRPSMTLNRIETYVQLAAMLWLFWDILNTKKRVNMALQVYVLGAYVSVVNTISNYLSGTVINDSGRYAGSGLNANGLALVLVIGLPIAWYLATSAQNTKLENVLRIVNYVYLPAAVFAVLLTASRTALFTMLPVAFFILSTSTRLKLSARLLASVGLVAALLLLQPLVPQTSLDRLSTTSTELTEGDLSGRTEIWERGFEVFEENTLLGTGSGTFKASVNLKDKSAHNTYLSILVETGFVGIVFFILIIIVSGSQALRLEGWNKWLWLTILLIWSVGITTMAWEIKKISWLLLIMPTIKGQTLPEAVVKSVHKSFPSRGQSVPQPEANLSADANL